MRRGFACVLASFAAAAFGQALEQEFGAELGALTPEDPPGYFELAEEVADLAQTPEDVVLARRLFVLAFITADEQVEDAWIRPSACIALAELDRDPVRRRWLRSVAALIDDRYAGTPGGSDGLDAAPEETRLAFAEFLGLTRAGRGALARQRLDQPGMEQLIDTLAAAVVSGRVAPSVSRMRSEASIWPCPQCGNSRAVPDPAEPETSRLLCPNCRGNPGPLLSQDELAGYVALEGIVLRADGQTWSAEHALLRTDPLRDPDVDLIPTLYSIDPERTVYNSGDWQRPDTTDD